MIKVVQGKTLRVRRTFFIILMFVAIIIVNIFTTINDKDYTNTTDRAVLSESSTANSVKALDKLAELSIKGRAPKTGYTRSEFGDGWAEVGGCDMRNIILRRQMNEVKLGSDDCVVLSGNLNDPYTGKLIEFVRGVSTSGDVQIDHVVALSDAWQKGAQNLDYEVRVQLANDPLELLAVDGPANQQKGDSDAASWLPSNKSYRCQYVARQIAVKAKYNLWITEAEEASMRRVLNTCKDQVLPIEK